jgi:hypothetical protein
MREMVPLKRTLGYPVIETALHTTDCTRCLEDYVASYGGNALVDELRALAGRPDRDSLREDLFCEERADQGWDYSILLPGNTLGALAVRDPGKRGTLQRAINHYHADVWHRYRAHVTPVAGIPLHSPQAGVAHLEFAIKRLQLKAIYLSGAPQRLAAGDTPPDYDPFWSRVVELGVPVLLDCPGTAPALEVFASALFFGQVTRRFPRLRVGLLDGGSGWRAPVCTAMASSLESRDRRLESFYFGLDSAELGAAAAINDNRGPVSARINAICASGNRRERGSASLHGLADGWRLVQEGSIGEDDLRAYLFDNPYRFYGEASATFFKGTAIEEMLAAPAPEPAVALAQ